MDINLAPQSEELQVALVFLATAALSAVLCIVQGFSINWFIISICGILGLVLSLMLVSAMGRPFLQYLLLLVWISVLVTIIMEAATRPGAIIFNISGSIVMFNRAE